MTKEKVWKSGSLKDVTSLLPGEEGMDTREAKIKALLFQYLFCDWSCVMQTWHQIHFFFFVTEFIL